MALPSPPSQALPPSRPPDRVGSVGLLTSQSLETDLTRVVHCTRSPIFGDWSSFRRFSLDSLILENGWLGSLNLEVTGHHQTYWFERNTPERGLHERRDC